MADYPSYTSIPQGYRSRILPLATGNIIDIAMDGSIRGQNFTAVYPWRFEIVHDGRAMADWTTIWNHYIGEGGSAFNFVWAKDLATYTCYYAPEPPRYELLDGANEVDIFVTLIGTAA